MKNLDYQLRQFAKVATYKSLSEAAIALNLTQSALSKQLREIERAVGHRVFRRHGRGVELTERGDMLWRAVQAAYKLVDSTIGQLKAMRSETHTGPLRVATLHGRSQAVMKELVMPVLGRTPGTHLTMIEGSAMDVCKLVEAGIADVGFVESTSIIPDTLEFSAIVSKTHFSSAINDDSQTSDVTRVVQQKEVSVIRIACLSDRASDSEGIDPPQGNETGKPVRDAIVANTTTPDAMVGTIERSVCDVARPRRHLVAITRKAERAA